MCWRVRLYLFLCLYLRLYLHFYSYVYLYVYCKRFAQPAGPILVLKQRHAISRGCGCERRPCSGVRVARGGPCWPLAVSTKGMSPNKHTQTHTNTHKHTPAHTSTHQHTQTHTSKQPNNKLSQQRNPNRRGSWNSKRQFDVVTF